MEVDRRISNLAEIRGRSRNVILSHTVVNYKYLIFLIFVSIELTLNTFSSEKQK